VAFESGDHRLPGIGLHLGSLPVNRASLLHQGRCERGPAWLLGHADRPG
jgi:hypothetical protein